MNLWESKRKSHFKQYQLEKFNRWIIIDHLCVEHYAKYKSCCEVCVLSCSAVSDSLSPHGLQPISLLSPWDFPGKNTGVDYHFLLQGIFLTWDQTHVSCILGIIFTTVPPGRHNSCPLIVHSLFKQTNKKLQYRIG